MKHHMAGHVSQRYLFYTMPYLLFFVWIFRAGDLDFEVAPALPDHLLTPSLQEPHASGVFKDPCGRHYPPRRFVVEGLSLQNAVFRLEYQYHATSTCDEAAAVDTVSTPRTSSHQLRVVVSMRGKTPRGVDQQLQGYSQVMVFNATNFKKYRVSIGSKTAVEL